MSEKFKEYLSENLPSVIEFICEEVRIPKEVINSIPALNVMFNSVIFIGTQITLQRFRSFLKVINFELGEDLEYFLKRIDNKDVAEYLHDSAKRSIDEKSEILRIALAIHTAKVIKNNYVTQIDIKIFRSLKDLSDLEIQILLKYIQLDHFQKNDETVFRYSSIYNDAISEETNIPSDEVGIFVKELFEHLKNLNFFNGGGIVIQDNDNDSFIIGSATSHFFKMIDILKTAKEIAVIN